MILFVNNVDGKTSLQVETDKSFESKGALFVIYISVTTLHSANQKQFFFSCTLLNAIKKKDKIIYTRAWQKNLSTTHHIAEGISLAVPICCHPGIHKAISLV